MAKKQGFGIGKSIGVNHLSVNSLPAKPPTNSIGAGKSQKCLWVDKEKEIDGIGMGVLSDGTAFLNGRGLARLCKISNARIVEMGQNWSEDSNHAMTEGVKAILREKGLMTPKPYIEITQPNGTAFYAYPDYVSLAVLEYYAFDRPNDVAKKNFRLLAGKALHDFIYDQVGYDPVEKALDGWQQYHDRVSLTYNAVPDGYFCIFKEIADMIVHLGQHGLLIDSSFVPDISVGKCWGTYWTDNALAEDFGDRIKFEHNYPEYFPQAASNPQVPWCYPEEALGRFRRWMREDYIQAGRFKKYLDSQVAKKALPPEFSQLAISAYEKTEAKKLPRR